MVEKAHRLLKRPTRIQVMLGWLLATLSLINPLLRELREMRFLWDRPYQVDHAKFAARFWQHFTPLGEGLERTLDWYRAES